jgi:uracil-DNA glycosylase
MNQLTRLELVEEILTCRRCSLHDRFAGPVPFFGPRRAELAVMGEAPGYQEDIEGRPFVGQAGQLVRSALEEVGLDPESLAWINTVSCFPKGTPTGEHVLACRPVKLKQLAAVSPTWMLLLGNVALQGFRPDLKIGKARGRPFLIGNIVAFATYHPAAALRNGVMDRGLREDLANWKKMLDAGRDQWHQFVPETCAWCANEVSRIDPTGIGACENHVEKVLS